jgi:hypothetical protein
LCLARKKAGRVISHPLEPGAVGVTAFYVYDAVKQFTILSGHLVHDPGRRARQESDKNSFDTAPGSVFSDSSLVSDRRRHLNEPRCAAPINASWGAIRLGNPQPPQKT